MYKTHVLYMYVVVVVVVVVVGNMHKIETELTGAFIPE